MISNKDILNAVGDVRDEYISESAKAAEYRETKILSDSGNSERKQKDNGLASRSGRLNSVKKNWKKWATAAACIVVAFVVISGVVSIGLGGFSKAESEDAVAESNSYYYSKSGLSSADSLKISEYDSSYEKGMSYYSSTDSSSAIYGDVDELSTTDQTYSNTEDVKLIYTASVSAQTIKFEESLATIKAAVEKAGGYIESQNTYTGGYYDSNSLRNCQLTIRVPASTYRSFIDGIAGEDITVYHLNESVEDVGLSYYETEQRLKTLYTKEERLHELLEKAASLSDIITLENELSDTEYDIDRYTSQLNRYDSLVNYSTINLSLEEVYNKDDGVQTDNSFGARLARAFRQSFKNCGEAIQEFILWISYNFVGIIIFAAIVFCLIKFRPITKLIRRIKNR